MPRKPPDPRKMQFQFIKKAVAAANKAAKGRRKMMNKQRQQQANAGKANDAQRRRVHAMEQRALAGEAAPPPPGKPANNTTCDFYISPNVPPAAPDGAAIPVHLEPNFRYGGENAEGDTTLRWTHVMYAAPTADIRDTYPAAPAHRVYIPDKTGTGFDVVFVELVGRNQANRYKRIFLDRRTITWPTNEL